MTKLEQLVSDETARAAEFPICRNKIYFAHAAIAPMPTRVVSAMTGYLEASSRKPRDLEDILARAAETRALAARLLGASPDETALIGPTSLGLNLIAQGLEWKEGDEVVCYAEDYPANIYPWTGLRERGVKVIYLQPVTLGEITPDVVEAALTPRTQLVALASAHFVTGYRVDTGAIGRLLANRGVLFAVDAIQTLGAIPFAAADVDFMSAGSQKWMLGPEGAGILYVKKSCWERLRPALLGACNIISPNHLARDEIKFVPGGPRYEPCLMNVPGMFGLKAALEILLEFGPGEIADRIIALNGRLAKSLESLGFKFAAPTSGPNASGIITCFHPQVQSERVVQILEANDVVVSLRYDRAGKTYVRISPHFYNTSEEIEKMTDVLRRELSR